MDIFKQKIIQAIKKDTGLEEIKLEIPPSIELGDYAFPCFELANKLKKSPAEIAQELSNKIKLENIKTQVKGPYLNFFVEQKKKNEYILREILKKRNKYGRGTKKNQNVMIEYSSPNTNKPLHVGHLRNDSIGMALSKILEFFGYDVLRTAIINDRGIHICKSMYAYEKWGRNKKPNKKPDHFVGDFYVMFEKKLKEKLELEEEAQEMLRKWEAKDKKVRALWKKMSNWVLKGMKETYEIFGSKFDFWTFESDIYEKTKPIIEDGLNKGIFFRGDKGDIIALLEPELPNKVVLRADGTSVYTTQDIVLAKMRFENYKINKLIYAVASEQNLHFRQLFSILRKLGYKFVDNCHHLSYGLVNLPSGRMKTREGTVIDADNLIAEVITLAKDEVKKREKKISKKELDKRSKAIALGAIKFYLLKMEPIKDIMFDSKKAIEFEGETGPYIQYANTRVSSILRKYGKNVSGNVNLSLLTHESEVQLVNILQKFPHVIEECAEHYKTNLLARYLLDLSQAFNSFYHSCPILQEKEDLKLARLVLIKTVQTVISQGLYLLGIETPERM